MPAERSTLHQADQIIGAATLSTIVINSLRPISVLASSWKDAKHQSIRAVRINNVNGVGQGNVSLEYGNVKKGSVFRRVVSAQE